MEIFTFGISNTPENRIDLTTPDVRNIKKTSSSNVSTNGSIVNSTQNYMTNVLKVWGELIEAYLRGNKQRLEKMRQTSAKMTPKLTEPILQSILYREW